MARDVVIPYDGWDMCFASLVFRLLDCSYRRGRNPIDVKKLASGSSRSISCVIAETLRMTLG